MKPESTIYNIIMTFSNLWYFTVNNLIYANNLQT